MASEVDDEGAGDGVNLDPVAIVGDLEATDHAGEEQGEEVAVAVRREAERGGRVGAGRVVVDVEHDVAAADVAVEVVRAEAQALAEEAEDVHPEPARLRREPLDDLPEPGRLVGPAAGAVADVREGAGEAEAVAPVLLGARVEHGAGVDPRRLPRVLGVEPGLVLRRQREELLAHRLHVPHRLQGHAVVHHLHCTTELIDR